MLSPSKVVPVAYPIFKHVILFAIELSQVDTTGFFGLKAVTTYLHDVTTYLNGTITYATLTSHHTGPPSFFFESFTSWPVCGRFNLRVPCLQKSESRGLAVSQLFL